MNTGSGRNTARWSPPQWVVAALGLVVLVLLAYQNAPNNDFHLDDYDNITNNGGVRINALSAGALVDAMRESPLPDRPVPYATFAVDWWRGGGEPRAFIWTNIALHAFTALLVFALFAALLSGASDDRPRGWATLMAPMLAAALWAAHPIQTQAVTYIVQRMAALAALFMLLAVFAYVQGRRARRRGVAVAWFAVTAASGALGALTKENAWMLPAVLVLVELSVVRSRRPLLRRGERVLLVAAAVGGLFALASTLADVGPFATLFDRGYESRSFTMVERVLTQPRVILFHLSQVVWPLPWRFSLEHDFALSTSLVRPWTTLAALALTIAWCAFAVWLFRRDHTRMVAMWMLWVPLTLVVESSIVPLEMVFEHRMYLPSVGLFGLVAVGLEALTRRLPRGRIWVACGGVLVVALLTLSTRQRIPEWHTKQSLCEASVRTAPNNARAWSCLGAAYYRNGRVDQAEVALRRSLELDASMAVTNDFLGLVHFDRGELDSAEWYFRRATQLDPRSASHMNHLGEVLFARGNAAAAEQMFAEAQARKPFIAAQYWNRALAMEALGDCPGARAQWLRYLELERDDEASRQEVREHLRTEHDTPGGKCSRPGRRPE